MDFIAIDFETANSNNNSACSIGLVCVEDNKIIDSKYYLIQPPIFEFDKKNIEIHGITPDDVRDKPKFNDVWKKICYLFDENLIIAHNAQFDISVLKCLQIEYDLNINDFNYMCSIPISTKVCEGVNNSLHERANYLGIEMGQHHNALDDAMTCANIVIETVNREREVSFESFLYRYKHLPLRTFSEIKYQRYFRKGKKKRFEHVNIGDISPTVNEIFYIHQLSEKNIVFTGVLSMPRQEAMQKVVNLGGVLKSGVSKKTDYLVVGAQDNSIVGDDGLSNKEEKAYALIAQGFDIKIIDEDEFYCLLKNTSF